MIIIVHGLKRDIIDCRPLPASRPWDHPALGYGHGRFAADSRRPFRSNWVSGLLAPRPATSFRLPLRNTTLRTDPKPRRSRLSCIRGLWRTAEDIKPWENPNTSVLPMNSNSRPMKWAISCVFLWMPTSLPHCICRQFLRRRMYSTEGHGTVRGQLII